MNSKTKAKKKRWPIIAAAVAGVIILLAASLYLYLDNLAGVGQTGHISSSFVTPKELQGDVLNFLICGLDYDEERTYGQKDQALTDVIMYVTLNIKENTVSILQIPRDCYVGTEVATGGTNKINGVFRKGGEGSHMDALAAVLYNQFGLTVDYYATLDMVGLYNIMDILDRSMGGLEMTVPWEIVDPETGDSLPAGTYRINAEHAAFILRNRNYGLADIKRLDTQRYFYLALYKQLTSMPLGDVVKLLPTYSYYVDTNMSIDSIASILMKLMNIPNENIFICKVPGGQDASCKYYAIERESLAQLLNDHFRPYTEKVAAEDLCINTLEFYDGFLYDPGTTLGQLDENAANIG